MSTLHNPDLAKLLLRLAVGVMMLFHGYSKLMHGVGFIEGMLESKGLPAFFAYGVYLGELVAPALLIIGYQTRIAAGFLIFTMLTAIYLVHAEELLALTKHGALELEVIYFYILTSLAIIFLGSGKYALERE